MSTARAELRAATDAAIGRRVHMIMWDRRMKQADLAESLGVQQSALSKRLRGERGWSVSDLLAAAKLLDTTVGYLVGETERPRPEGPDGDDGSELPRLDSNQQPFGNSVRALRLPQAA